MRGIYILMIEVKGRVRVRTGALGVLEFSPGIYAYVGSAQQALEKRVYRHLRKVKRRFWHIDYLLAKANVEVLRVFWKRAGKAVECALAKQLGRIYRSVRGFGSSDCTCRSHLFKIKDYQFLCESMTEMSVGCI